MKRLFLLLICLCALPCRGAEKDTVRVLTFNLRYINDGDLEEKAWTARRDTAAELIKKDAADFVGLQEAFRQMIDDLKARVPGYGEIGAGREDGKQKGEYSAILYKEETWEAGAYGTFWLSDTPEVAGSATWGNKVTRICTWARFKHKKTGEELFVYNAHFDHQSQPSREKAALLMLERIRSRGSTAPVIVTGDFNASPDNAALVSLCKGPPALADVWLKLNKEVPAAESGTVHFFTGKKDGMRIDYILCTEDIMPVEASIIHDAKDGHFPSDHFPVRATLRLP